MFNSKMKEHCQKCWGCLQSAMPLISRIVVGWVFLEAGWGKLHNLEKVTAFFTELGIPAANLQAPFVATVEFVGGLCIILGLAVRVVSIPLSIVMVVALITAKRSEIGAVTDLFAITDFLYIVIFGWLIAYGAGKISVDHFWCQRKK